MRDNSRRQNKTCFPLRPRKTASVNFCAHLRPGKILPGRNKANMSENVQIGVAYSCFMAVSRRADQKRGSPYHGWQLETGLHPRDFLVALFCRVCVLFRSGRGERISAI